MDWHPGGCPPGLEHEVSPYCRVGKSGEWKNEGRHLLSKATPDLAGMLFERRRGKRFMRDLEGIYRWWGTAHSRVMRKDQGVVGEAEIGRARSLSTRPGGVRRSG